MKSIFLTACLLIIWMSDVFSQRKEMQATYLSSMFNHSFAEKSPNVASFMKYGNYPVNYFTGLPNIEIPIYTIKEGAFELPLKLRYHAGGHKVDEIASWVGLGWDLNTGGVISREVRGLPDDYFVDFAPPMGTRKVMVSQDSEGFYTHTVAGKGYLRKIDPNLSIGFTTAHAMQEGWLYHVWAENDPRNIQDWGKDDAFENYETSNPNGHLSMDDMAYLYPSFGEHISEGYDTEPDIFRFNFNGYSGTFLFDYDNNIVQVPVTDLKIEKTGDLRNEEGRMDGFKITTPDGIVYFFETVENTMQERRVEEIPCQPVPGRITFKERYQMSYNSSWQLSKVETPDGRIVNFKYEEYPITVEQPVNKIQFEWPGWNCDLPGGRDFAATYQSLLKIKSKLLKEISSSNLKVEFAHASRFREDLTTSKSLRSIKVFSVGSSESVKSVYFDYSYFLSKNTDNKAVDKRLQLVEVLESVPGILTQPYLFYYVDKKLPPLNSAQQDMYGYYNANGALYMIPKLYIYPDLQKHNRYRLEKIKGYPDNSDGTGSFGQQYFLDGADRKLNVGVIDCGMLSKMQYPTGGTTEFYYEPNDYYDAAINDNVYGGGLRIKKQISKSGSSPDIILEYSYKKEGLPNQSSGMQVSTPVFAHPTPVLSYPGYSYTALKGNRAQLFKNLIQRYTLNQNPLEAVQGATVGYTKTTVNHKGNGTEEFYYSFPLAADQDVDKVSFSGNSFKRTQSLNKAKMTTAGFSENFLLRQSNEIAAVNDGFYYYGSYCPPFAPNPDYDAWRGLLEEKKVKDASGKLLEQELYNYGGIRPNPYPYSQSEAEYFRRPPALKGYNTLVSKSGNIGVIHSEAAFAFYNPYITNSVQLHGKSIRIYDLGDVSNQRYSETRNEYRYMQDHLYPISKSILDSRLEEWEEVYIYPSATVNAKWTYAGDDNESSALINMVRGNIINKPVEIVKTKGRGTNAKVVEAVLSTYKNIDVVSSDARRLTLPVIDKTWKVYPKAPLFKKPGSKATFETSGSKYSSAAGGNIFIKDENYTPVTHYEKYDASGKVIQFKNESGITNALVWGYNGQYPIANIINGSSSDVGFTSFEENNKEQWYWTGNIMEGNASDGGRYLSINPPMSGEISKSGLDPGKKYKVSFWANTVNHFAPIDLVGQGFKAMLTANNWTLYEKSISGVSNFSMAIYDINIDNLLIAPIESQVETFSYKPLVGMRSKTDDRGITEYYEYDALQRLKLVRDYQGNVKKSYEYNYHPN